MKRKNLFGVYIGRFQPLHNAHMEVILESLEKHVDKLIIIIGSASTAPTIKNPFSYEQRERMITDALIEAGVDRHRFIIRGVPDYLYNEQKWLTEIQAVVSNITKGTQDVALMGHVKDDSSYYLKSFPMWDFYPSKIKTDLDATTVRNAYFGENTVLKDSLPPVVANYLTVFKATDSYNSLAEEYKYIQDYKEQQKAWPYPMHFITVDAVVIKSSHVLLVRRGANPGKGLLALPGGFLDVKETVLQSTIRELREETKLPLLDSVLESARKETAFFDAPSRSLRGRTVTHATMYDLGSGLLPKVQGSDDAAEALWMPVNEALANPALFMDDHWSILYHFLMRY